VSTITQLDALLSVHGSDARYHRAVSTVACPCRTPEGFRDPEWHLAAPPGTPVCDEDATLPDSGELVDVIVKAFIQPIQSTRATRLSEEYITQMFGTILADDHLGIFPVRWNSVKLDFLDWPQSGSAYVEYFGRKFLVVNANLIPDPSDGNPEHHWELGLRLID